MSHNLSATPDEIEKVMKENPHLGIRRESRVNAPISRPANETGADRTPEIDGKAQGIEGQETCRARWEGIDYWASCVLPLGHSGNHQEKRGYVWPQKQEEKGIEGREQQGRKTTEIEMVLYCWAKSEESLGRVSDVIIQPPPFKLAYRCTYRPDLRLTRAGVRENYEAKGKYMKQKYEDGWVKLKVAATMFPDELFYLFEHNKAGQLWIIQIPPIDGKPTKGRTI